MAEPARCCNPDVLQEGVRTVNTVLPRFLVSDSRPPDAHRDKADGSLDRIRIQRHAVYMTVSIHIRDPVWE